MFISGESVGVGLLREIKSLFPNARFSSAYGSTEAGLVTFLDHEHQFDHSRSCGRALQGVEVRLVDDDGVEVPVGQPGEIIVRAGLPGTYTVAAGYLGPAGLTTFTDAEGWFHTGDVATVDTDGFYVIVDRKKDMILSGGMNIASKEVEEIIAEHSDVDCITERSDDTLDEPHRCGWVRRFGFKTQLRCHTVLRDCYLRR